MGGYECHSRSQAFEDQNVMILDLSELGATGNGKKDDTFAFLSGIKKMQKSDSVFYILKGSKDKIYRITSELIFSSNVLVNLDGGTLITKEKIIFKNIDIFSDEYKCGIVNVNFMDARGITFSNVNSGIIENITFNKYLRGSAINIQYSSNVTINNVNINVGAVGGNKIACLLFNSDSTVVNDLHTNSGKWFVAGVQVKGGKGNIVRNSSIENVSEFKKGFLARGDAPWKKSRTKGLQYPFEQGSFDSPDEKRATTFCRFESCTVKNSSPGKWNCFHAQESHDILFKDCKVINSGLRGFVSAVVKNGNEKNIIYENCEVQMDVQHKNSRGFQIIGQVNQPISGMKIQNCTVNNLKTGIYLEHSSGSTIENNLLENCEQGVYLKSNDVLTKGTNEFINCKYEVFSPSDLAK